MLPPIPDPADYGMSVKYGFLPDCPPLEVLPNPYYAKWEHVVCMMQPLLLSRRLHSVVDDLPVLSTRHLHTEREWRRAYVVLSFMLHGYVWGGSQPQEVSQADYYQYQQVALKRRRCQVIPPQLTIPLFRVCEHLELPPVATYSGLCLWNYKPIFADEPADSLSNLACINTFTGSLDEQWFFLVSVAIEARGAPSIPLMLRAISAARSDNSEQVVECLQLLAEILDAVGSVLQQMYEHCDPYVFYHRIRPYLAGSKNMGDAGLPRGLLYDDGSGRKGYRQYGGGSNAQSSLIQFFDIVLGIEHRPTGVGPSDESTTNATTATTTNATTSDASESAPKSRHSFIHEMREYMPGSHRRFLEHVDAVANIREYVESHRQNTALSCAYDGCLAMLRALRDKHIQMVSRYIIVKSREARSMSPSTAAGAQQRGNAGIPAINLPITPRNDTTRGTKNLSSSSSSSKKLRGTGGTALIPFLKQARDETEEPTVNAWVRRLLRRNASSSQMVDPDDAAGSATLSKVGENVDGHLEVVGLAGTWRADESEGGICHW